MTGDEALAYLSGLGRSKARAGVENTRELLRRLGDPQKGLRCIHVAGSNGKGSTCAMLEAALRACGYRTGLFTSPHIHTLRERIRVDGAAVTPEELGHIVGRVRGAAGTYSLFDILTAAALLFFRERACDAVILEVGMGGELDATNAIDAPALAVFCNIGLEHTAYLGDTVEKIAATKAGIIKPGSHAVFYDGAPAAEEVLRRVCREKGVPFTAAPFSAVTPLSADWEGQDFLWEGKPFRLGLLGDFQLHNAATALTALRVLRENGWRVSEDAVRRAFSRLRRAARMELLSREPPVFLDGGHNPQCAEAAAETLAHFRPGKKWTLLLGFSQEKERAPMLDALLPLAAECFCVTPPGGMGLPALLLAGEILRRGTAAEACGSIREGLSCALSAAGRDGGILCFGSLYTAGEIRDFFHAPSLEKPEEL